MKIALRPAAELDIAEAMAWYDEQKPGLGDEFLARVERLFEQIVERPARFPRTHKIFHRAILGRFPYTIYFSIDADRIIVFAIYHQRRDPRVLARRLSSD